jgi:hypothetical protein
VRISRVRIGEWRNLEDVDISIPLDSPLVCLVGENGTGKSAVLELLSAAAHKLGISSGVEIPRGDPFADVHSFEIVAVIAKHELVDAGVAPDWWDGSLSLVSSRSDGGHTESVEAGGADDPNARLTAAHGIINHLRQRKETQHLRLDADRAYPPMQIQSNEIGQIYERDWLDADFTKQFSFRPTKTLYEEWHKYFIGLEGKAATDLVAEIRRARDRSEEEPKFVDPFERYKEYVREVLPHLRFVGVESTGARRTLRFDSSGLELTFGQLSGGEREIAFLIGQIVRFGLERGLLLIDEPELHLNPDLVRSWLAFLQSTIQDGQVWIATHSLEAVEVAGPDCTIVFERNPESRRVVAPKKLSGRPLLAALSAAVGAPAFSLVNLRFVFVEGERRSGERERYHMLSGHSSENRFLEGGSCTEVLRRFAYLRDVADETDEQIKIGAVIDRDFRSDEEVAEIVGSGAHVLGCHEVENLFLFPGALADLLAQADMDPGTATRLVLDASDCFAGLWIVERAMASGSVVDLTTQMKKPFSALGWNGVVDNWEALVEESCASLGEVQSDESWKLALNEARRAYEQLRPSDGLWAQCLGKQSLSRLAPAVGLSGVDALARRISRLWSTGSAPCSEPQDELVAYVGNVN